MSTPPPPADWIRVLVRPHHRGDLRDVMADLEAEWNEALLAWVIEPTPEQRLDRERGQWKPHRSWSAHFKVEVALRDLRGLFDLEWQVTGPSALPRRKEDVEPPVRINPGWKTPYWPESGKGESDDE